jgi:hypothetical protein
MNVNWNKGIRVTHRWLSIAFTAAITINLVAILHKKYTNTLGLMAVSVLALCFVTGMYLFVLPYFIKWRSVRRAA